MSSIPTITCPLDCLASFSEVQEYDHPLIDELLRRNAVYNPEIVDIGANVGAFTIWASDRWEKYRRIQSFEPFPQIHDHLALNVSHLPRVHTFQIAVSPKHLGVIEAGRNRLCSSMKSKMEGFCGGVVETIEAEQIPTANIIKIDTEGSEGYICEHLTHIPEYLVLEYHSDELMIQCLNAMKGKMTLIGATITQPGLGILKWGRL